MRLTASGLSRLFITSKMQNERGMGQILQWDPKQLLAVAATSGNVGGSGTRDKRFLGPALLTQGDIHALGIF